MYVFNEIYILRTYIESEQNSLMHVLDVNVQYRKSESHRSKLIMNKNNYLIIYYIIVFHNIKLLIIISYHSIAPITEYTNYKYLILLAQIQIFILQKNNKLIRTYETYGNSISMKKIEPIY